MPEHHYARQDYAFISGAIRVRDREILDVTDISRMIDAPDLEEAFTILNDTDYADNLLGVEAKDFPIALNRDLVQLNKDIRQQVQSRRLLSILFLQEDWHNIKLAFKEKFLNEDPGENFSDAGLFDAQDVRQYVLNQRFNNINKYTKREIARIDEALQKEAFGHRIDMLCDQSFYTLLQEKAISYGNPEVIMYVQRSIDIANLKILIRAKNLEGGNKIIAQYAITGGSFTPQTMIAAQKIETPWDELKTYLDKPFYDYLADAGTKNNYRLFEKAAFEYISRGIKQSRYFAYGPEVVLDYFFRKYAALQNIRLILIGKANEIRPDDIREKIITI